MEDVRGFSLVEAVIVVALIATALLAFAHLAATAVASNTVARHHTAASMLALEKVEELRAIPGTGVGADYVDRWGGSTSRAGAAYERHWTTEPLPGSALGTVLIRVRVAAVGTGPASAARLVAAARVR